MKSLIIHIESCEECDYMNSMYPLSDGMGCLCRKTAKFLTEDEWQSETIPEWCPLPDVGGVKEK